MGIKFSGLRTVGVWLAYCLGVGFGVDASGTQPLGSGGEGSSAPIACEPLVISFVSSRRVVPIPLDAPSPDKDYALHIPLEELAPAVAGVAGSAGEAALGQEIAFAFSDLAGAQLRLKLIRLSPQRLAVQFRYLLQQGLGRNFPLSVERLERARVGLTRSLASCDRDLAMLAEERNRIQQELRFLDKWPVSDRQEATRIMLLLADKRTRIPRLNRRIDEKHQQREAVQRRLDHVPVAAEFVTSTAGKQIPFRIMKLRNGVSIVLVDGTGDGSRRLVGGALPRWAALSRAVGD